MCYSGGGEEQGLYLVLASIHLVECNGSHPKALQRALTLSSCLYDSRTNATSAAAEDLFAESLTAAVEDSSMESLTARKIVHTKATMARTTKACRHCNEQFNQSKYVQ